MKLLHLTNDFATSNNNTLLVPAMHIAKPSGISNQGKTRFTPVALLLLLVFAGFSLTIPLHPVSSSDSCNTGLALAADADTSNCSDLAIIKINYTAIVNTLSDLAIGNLRAGKLSNVSETSKVILSSASQTTDATRHNFATSHSY